MIRVREGIVKRVLLRLQMPQHQVRLGFFSTRDCPTESALQHCDPKTAIDRFVIGSGAFKLKQTWAGWVVGAAWSSFALKISTEENR